MLRCSYSDFSNQCLPGIQFVNGFVGILSPRLTTYFCTLSNNSTFVTRLPVSALYIIQLTISLSTWADKTCDGQGFVRTFSRVLGSSMNWRSRNIEFSCSLVHRKTSRITAITAFCSCDVECSFLLIFCFPLPSPTFLRITWLCLVYISQLF